MKSAVFHGLLAPTLLRETFRMRSTCVCIMNVLYVPCMYGKFDENRHKSYMSSPESTLIHVCTVTHIHEICGGLSYMR